MAAPVEFRDTSCAPIGNTLKYERGDGQKMELEMAQKVHHSKARATVTVPRGTPLSINPKAGINLSQLAKPATKPRQTTTTLPDNICDHPSVGGRMTVFVLFYGDYFELHQKCLKSILATIPANRLDLRVGSNMACKQTLEMLEQYVDSRVITKHYRHDTNAYKYPVMREMFWDESCPIQTKWVLWFDDDSICDVNKDWFTILSTHIAQHHKEREAHMIGATYLYNTNKQQRDVLESRPWYKRRPWRGKDGKPSPNGNQILFSVGGFWALTVEAMRAANIPDLGTGLQHTGGDWQIGEQLYQAGYGLKQFNGKKQFVRTSSVPRRGAVTPTIDRVVRPVVVQDITPVPVIPAIQTAQAELQGNTTPVIIRNIVQL